MIIDQSEIDSLLAEAEGLAQEAATEVMAPAETAPAAPPPPKVSLPRDPEVRRVLRLKVPAIVQLARRTMPISSVRDLSVGAIIEFEKNVDDQLDLMINNRPVGKGTCVKVGENFGLRVSSIVSKANRIRSLAGE